MFWEAWDAGLTEEMYTQLDPPKYPGLGTKDHFLHLLQPHEELWNLPYPPIFGPSVSNSTCCNYR
jgi:hypothetical protein